MTTCDLFCRVSAIGKVIKKLRNEHGWTQGELANRAGFPTHTAISKRERGDLQTDGPDRRRIAKAFGMSYESFMDMVEEAEAQDRGAETGIPMIGTVPAGSVTRHWQLWEDPTSAEEFIDRGDIIAADTFALKVVGDSMLPDIPEGSIVVCRRVIVDADRLPFHAADLVVVSFSEDSDEPGVTLGYWQPRPDGTIVIRKANAAFYDPIPMDLDADPPSVVGVAAVIEKRIRTRLGR